MRRSAQIVPREAVVRPTSDNYVRDAGLVRLENPTTVTTFCGKVKPHRYPGDAKSRHWPVALSVLALACASQPRPEPAQPPPQQQQPVALAVSPGPSHLEPKQPLPPLARSFVKGRMANHARNMTDLIAAIMSLDYAAIDRGARGIAAGGDLARPLTGDASELNAQLPERFFDYQDDLRKNALTLAEAAQRADARGVADAYGHLSESCVNCHAAYRAGR